MTRLPPPREQSPPSEKSVLRSAKQDFRRVVVGRTISKITRRVSRLKIAKLIRPKVLPAACCDSHSKPPANGQQDRVTSRRYQPISPPR